MNGIVYHSLQPTNLKTSYGEYDTLDFDIVFAGRALRLNNLRFAADIDTPSAGTGGALAADNLNTEFYLDPQVGAHSFIDSIATEFSNAGANSGVVESLTEYPRWVKIVHVGTQERTAAMNSGAACELRAPSMKITNTLLRGSQPGKPSTNAYVSNQVSRRDADFSVRPYFVLNSASSAQGEATLTERKVGRIRVSVRLARFNNVFNGNNAVSDITSYSLKNVRLLYQTFPDPGTDVELVCRTRQNLKQNVQGDAITLMARLPISANAMTAAFFPTAKINNAFENTLALPEPPNVNRIEFSFNDSTNAYISYELLNRNTILHRAIQSLGGQLGNDITTSKLKSGDNYIIGLNFGGDFINLARQKFSLLLNSGIGTSTEDYTLYSYFHGVMQI